MTPPCQITQNGAGRHALPTKLETLLPAALYLFRPELCPRTRKSAAYRCSNQDTLCPSFRCRSLVSLGGWFPAGPYSHPPSPWEWFPKAGLAPGPRLPSPGEGFQRERAAALALRVVGGPGRSRNALVLFFRGVGRVLFQKRMRPTSLRWEPPLAGVREMWGTFQWAKPIEKNCTAICSISASAHTAAPLPQWVSAYPAGSGGWRPALRPRSWRPARPDRSLSGWPRTVRRFRPPAPSE